jgi:hypothetical protein
LSNSFHSSRLYGFLCELRRRKVYRVAASYGVVGWLIIQFAVAVFPLLALPIWATRLVVILVLAGFPIALVLAWAFDVGPGGIHVTLEGPPEAECPPAFSARRNNILALVLFGLTISVLTGYFIFSQVAAGRKLDKSIAVLPFTNFSDDPSNAYFADGIQDDVLTNLARIGDLKIISRTLVMPFAARPATSATSAPIPKSFLKANVYSLKKDQAKAKGSYEEARMVAEVAVRESPDDAPRHALLGLIYAGLGRCDEATAEGKRAVQLLPETVDAFDGPFLAISRGRIALACGDTETALQLLDHSLETPYGMTV